jgi:hypothetical protein
LATAEWAAQWVIWLTCSVEGVLLLLAGLLLLLCRVLLT